MRILIDMNLSPEWEAVFERAGWPSRHWSDVGSPCAPDSEIMEWARAMGFIVFTHDLDFSAILAATGAVGPGVVQLRCEDPRPSAMEVIVVSALRSHREALEAGALITLDPRRLRLTLLPLKRC